MVTCCSAQGSHCVTAEKLTLQPTAFDRLSSMRIHLARVPLAGLLLLFMCTPSVPAQSTSPFVGRWDFDVHGPSGIGANWLGIKDNGGHLEVWFQPVGGHVYPVKDVTASGSHLSFTAEGGKTPLVWDLIAAGDKLTGTQTKGSEKTALTGLRAPKLNRPYPKAWSQAEPLFNGKNLDGWEPIGNVTANHWIAKDGILINQEHGANLKTTRTFDDFKVHFEVKCPDGGNSGFYSRGRYEMQIAYEPPSEDPPIRSMGAIYGRITPSQELPRTPGKWESFDITLVGRNISIVRNGTKIIDNKEIEGITGGALDADEGKPGPFYIQGDHTGGLQFRNITVQVPKS